MENEQNKTKGNSNRSPEELFNKFIEAEDCPEIIQSFQRLVSVTGVKAETPREFYYNLKSKLISWKCKSLWELLDIRANQKEYSKGTLCEDIHALVIGCGPIGIRTAIELALLGAQVVIVEKRQTFSRNNVLHLWPFLLTDFRSLGAKKFYGKFCSGSIDHISIRRLQSVLLKTALIFGVKVFTGVTFEKIIEPISEEEGWKCSVTPSGHSVNDFELDVLIGADGKKNVLPGFAQIEMRGTLAIGVTANFVNYFSEEEARVEEISGIAYQFNPTFFQRLRNLKGISLENIVYYKDETHYFVMTAVKSSLLERGVLKEDFGNNPRKLLSPDNINQDNLISYVNDAVGYATKGMLKHRDLKTDKNGIPDIAVFDFTSIKKAENSARIKERKGHKLLIGLVGDSLLEPFWPTGSGCARGVLSALDAAWMVRSFAMEKPPLQILSEREVIYRLLSGTSNQNLQKNFDLYTINPSSRYMHIPQKKIQEVYHLFDTDDPVNADFTLGSPTGILTTKGTKKKRVSLGTKKRRKNRKHIKFAVQSSQELSSSKEDLTVMNAEDKGKLAVAKTKPRSRTTSECLISGGEEVNEITKESRWLKKSRKSRSPSSQENQSGVKKKNKKRKSGGKSSPPLGTEDEEKAPKRRTFFLFGRGKSKPRLGRKSPNPDIPKENKAVKEVITAEKATRVDLSNEKSLEESAENIETTKSPFSRNQGTRRSAREIIAEMEARSRNTENSSVKGKKNNDEVPRRRPFVLPPAERPDKEGCTQKTSVKRTKSENDTHTPKCIVPSARADHEASQRKTSTKSALDIRTPKQPKTESLWEELSSISPSARDAIPALSKMSPENQTENHRHESHDIVSAMRMAGLMAIATPLLIDEPSQKNILYTERSWFSRNNGHVKNTINKYDSLTGKPFLAKSNEDGKHLRSPVDMIDGSSNYVESRLTLVEIVNKLANQKLTPNKQQVDQSPYMDVNDGVSSWQPTDIAFVGGTTGMSETEVPANERAIGHGQQERKTELHRLKEDFSSLDEESTDTPIKKDLSSQINQRTMISAIKETPDIKDKTNNTNRESKELLTSCNYDEKDKAWSKSPALAKKEMERLMVALIETMSKERAEASIRFLISMFRRIQRNPREEKFRRIFKSRVKFKKFVWTVRYAKMFMFASGWVEAGNFLIFSAERNVREPLAVLNTHLGLLTSGTSVQISTIKSTKKRAVEARTSNSARALSFSTEVPKTPKLSKTPSTPRTPKTPKVQRTSNTLPSTPKPLPRTPNVPKASTTPKPLPSTPKPLPRTPKTPPRTPNVPKASTTPKPLPSTPKPLSSTPKTTRNNSVRKTESGKRVPRSNSCNNEKTPAKRDLMRTSSFRNKALDKRFSESVPLDLDSEWDLEMENPLLEESLQNSVVKSNRSKSCSLDFLDINSTTSLGLSPKRTLVTPDVAIMKEIEGLSNTLDDLMESMEDLEPSEDDGSKVQNKEKGSLHDLNDLCTTLDYMLDSSEEEEFDRDFHRWKRESNSKIVVSPNNEESALFKVPLQPSVSENITSTTGNDTRDEVIVFPETVPFTVDLNNINAQKTNEMSKCTKNEINGIHHGSVTSPISALVKSDLKINEQDQRKLPVDNKDNKNDITSSKSTTSVESTREQHSPKPREKGLTSSNKNNNNLKGNKNTLRRKLPSEPKRRPQSVSDTQIQKRLSSSTLKSFDQEKKDKPSSRINEHSDKCTQESKPRIRRKIPNESDISRAAKSEKSVDMCNVRPVGMKDKSNSSANINGATVEIKGKSSSVISKESTNLSSKLEMNVSGKTSISKNSIHEKHKLSVLNSRQSSSEMSLPTDQKGEEKRNIGRKPKLQSGNKKAELLKTQSLDEMSEFKKPDTPIRLQRPRRETSKSAPGKPREQSLSTSSIDTSLKKRPPTGLLRTRNARARRRQEIASKLDFLETSYESLEKSPTKTSSTPSIVPNPDSLMSEKTETSDEQHSYFLRKRTSISRASSTASRSSVTSGEDVPGISKTRKHNTASNNSRVTSKRRLSAKRTPSNASLERKKMDGILSKEEQGLLRRSNSASEKPVARTTKDYPEKIAVLRSSKATDISKIRRADSSGSETLRRSCSFKAKHRKAGIRSSSRSQEGAKTNSNDSQKTEPASKVEHNVKSAECSFNDITVMESVTGCASGGTETSTVTMQEMHDNLRSCDLTRIPGADGKDVGVDNTDFISSNYSTYQESVPNTSTPTNHEQYNNELIEETLRERRNNAEESECSSIKHELQTEFKLQNTGSWMVFDYEALKDSPKILEKLSISSENYLEEQSPRGVTSIDVHEEEVKKMNKDHSNSEVTLIQGKENKKVGEDRGETLVLANAELVSERDNDCFYRDNSTKMDKHVQNGSVESCSNGMTPNATNGEILHYESKVKEPFKTKTKGLNGKPKASRIKSQSVEELASERNGARVTLEEIQNLDVSHDSMQSKPLKSIKKQKHFSFGLRKKKISGSCSDLERSTPEIKLESPSTKTMKRVQTAPQGLIKTPCDNSFSSPHDKSYEKKKLAPYKMFKRRKSHDANT